MNAATQLTRIDADTPVWAGSNYRVYDNHGEACTHHWRDHDFQIIEHGKSGQPLTQIVDGEQVPYATIALTAETRTLPPRADDPDSKACEVFDADPCFRK